MTKPNYKRDDTFLLNDQLTYEECVDGWYRSAMSVQSSPIMHPPLEQQV